MKWRKNYYRNYDLRFKITFCCLKIILIISRQFLWCTSGRDKSSELSVCRFFHKSDVIWKLAAISCFLLFITLIKSNKDFALFVLKTLDNNSEQQIKPKYRFDSNKTHTEEYVLRLDSIKAIHFISSFSHIFKCFREWIWLFFTNNNYSIIYCSDFCLISPIYCWTDEFEHGYFLITFGDKVNKIEFNIHMICAIFHFLMDFYYNL